MAAKTYLEARIWGVHQRNVKDIDPNLNLVDAVDTNTVAGSYSDNDVVLCVETGTCIGVSMVALSYYKRSGGSWSLLSYTPQSTMANRTQKFGVDGNVTTPIEIPDPVTGNHPVKKSAFDTLQNDLEEADTALQTNISNEATARANKDQELEDFDTDLKTRLRNQYKPTYSYPSLTLSVSKQYLEVGEPFTPVITLNYTQRDAGAADFSKAGIEIDENTFPIDDALWNIAGNVITYVGQKVMYNPGALNLEVILAYAAGILKQDTLFGEDYPTGQIGAGQVGSGEKTILWQFWSQIGSGASLPASAAAYRTASSRQKDMAFPLMVAANALKEWIITPEGFELDTVKDNGNLGVDITSEYILVNNAFSANDYDGDSFPAKLYVRSHAVAYGIIVEHAITLKYAE